MIFKVNVDAAHNEEGRENEFKVEVMFEGSSADLLSAVTVLVDDIFKNHSAERALFCLIYPMAHDQLHKGGGDDDEEQTDVDED